MAELLRMPEVAAGATEAVLSAWNLETGAAYSAGDILVTIETDKAVVDVEAEADGVLLRTLVEPGTTVEVGSPIAVTGAAGEVVDDAAVAALGVAAAPEVALAAAEEGTPTPEDTPVADTVAAAAAESDHDHGDRVFASPLARRLARESGVSLAGIIGTGPGGRIRRRDVEAALAADRTAPPAAAPASAPRPVAVPPGAAAAYVDEPNSRMRNAIAARLTESKQTAPHFYLRGSARVDRLLELRKEVNDGGTVKVSVNDLVVKAVAAAHVVVPAMNVLWTGDAIRRFSGVDVSVAVATDNGLVTPVVRGVESLTLTQLAATTADLALRAKEKRLQQHELEGGSISVSNLGMYGTEEFAAILNPPQSAILAVGAARQEPVVVDGALAVGTVMRVTLSVDHRPVDGATAAEWMRAFVDLLEHPARILA